MGEYVLFVLKSIWIFILGAVLAVIGLFCLIYRPDMGSNSFIIMLMGLFFTGAGSIYGKRKLGYGESLVSVSSERQKNLKFSEREGRESLGRFSFRKEESETEFPWEKRDPRRFSGRPETDRETAEKQEELLEMTEDSMGTGEQERTAERPVTRPVQSTSTAEPPDQEPVKSPETKTQAPGESKKGKIIRIVVCPKCGAENEPKNKFCFSCGFNIEEYEKKAKKGKSKSRKKSSSKTSKKKSKSSSKKSRSKKLKEKKSMESKKNSASQATTDVSLNAS